ncbi:MAG TPA: universal stress protein [Gemmatimonadales bacterium]
MPDRPVPRLDHVVIGTDFAEPSRAAATWVARHLAPDARFTFVHALGDTTPPKLGEARPLPGRAEQEAARAGAAKLLSDMSETFPGRTPQVVIGDDRAEWVIAEVAESSGADLIVVGPHGEEHSRRSRLGSTAERLIRMSPVSVLMADAPTDSRPRHLLVPVDYVDLTPAVLDWARLVASGGGAVVTLMHAATGDEEDAGAGEWLEAMTRELPGSARAELVATTRSAGEEILDAATRLGADMIVMGRRGRGRALPGVLGSTVSDVLRNAERPVLVVVDPRDAILDDWGTTTEAA